MAGVRMLTTIGHHPRVWPNLDFSKLKKTYSLSSKDVLRFYFILLHYQGLFPFGIPSWFGR